MLFDRRRNTPAAARVFVSEALGRWGRTGRIEDVLLCVSELTTNSVVHGAPPGRRILVRVERHPALMRVEVHDGGSRMPVRREPQDGVEGGRGLPLVSAVADHWGVSERQGSGKCVWAVFHDTTAPAG
ncbi:ATP-binding protein [Streptomyces sp. NPDC047000]|uniref:ATP-binding protein n=1 Tax=Streptomyces sp. NPDC047000 TaxID=3155474 RepID=UPI0033E391D8